MNTLLDWSDYHVLLQIESAGSLSAAARASGRSHPTLMRHLNRIEEQVGSRLFERLRQGYRPTAAGEELLEAARQMADLATAAERRVVGRDRRPGGTVVLTTTDTLLAGLLAPALAAFREAYPDIVLDVRVSNDVHDLARRDADIALRPAVAPEPYLVGRRLGVIRQALYAAATFADVASEDLPLVGPSADMPYDALHAWIRATGIDGRCRLRGNSVLAIYAIARAGAAAAVLPTYLAGDGDGLERRGDPIGALDTDLWLLVHPDLRRTARVRAVLDVLTSCRTITQALDASPGTGKDSDDRPPRPLR